LTTHWGGNPLLILAVLPNLLTSRKYTQWVAVHCGLPQNKKMWIAAKLPECGLPQNIKWWITAK